jgi:hypothetical protein
MKGPDADKWTTATEEEFVRLIDVTKTIKFVQASSKPADRKASYLNLQCSTKIKDGAIVQRVRGCYGGDKGDYTGDSSVATADLETIKMFANAVISEQGAEFTTADIKDYFLTTNPIPNGRVEYVWINLDQIPTATQLRYNVNDFAICINGVWKVLAVVLGGMYGLKYAGLIAKLLLDKRLAIAGYHEKKNTPCLYQHESRPISFTLVVDDFGIKSQTHALDKQHLLDTLRQHYTITTGDGSKYVGISFDWQYAEQKVVLSMPGYVEKALARFDVVQGKPVHTPSNYIAPVFGRKGSPELPQEDLSPALTKEGVKRMQEIVGTFLFYARAVDPTMLPAVNMLARHKKTERDMAAAEHFMQYAATWPNAQLTYHASDMVLYLQSDLGYLNERDARSRVGGLGYLGNKPPASLDPTVPPSFINGPICAISGVLDVVVGSAMEGEYGAMYKIAMHGEVLRNTLADLGYPQAATPLQGDNKVAVGIANNKFKQRRSKAIDMRFHWIRDRVKQGHYNVYWRQGNNNLADYFTKIHSATHHRAMRKFFVTDPPLPVPPDTARARRLQRRQ